MFAYIWGFLGTLLGYGFIWWFSLIVTYFFGVGFFLDYPTARARINAWQNIYVMPESFPLWWIAVPFLLWVVMRIAHREGMRRWGAARLIFDSPYIDRDVPLFGWVAEPINMGPQKFRRDRIGSNDIAKIIVRNYPYDSEHGRAIDDAYVEVIFYNRQNHNVVSKFEFPRWEENPKPGYEGNPSDHFPFEWNWRSLKPNRARNTLNFALKSTKDEDAFGFRGRSQLDRHWKDPSLCVPPGDYLIKIVVMGTGMRKPVEKWLGFENPGADKRIKVYETRERVYESRFKTKLYNLIKKARAWRAANT